jgi:NTP pyrophosphatase (non-canonical NTP hydrolase)
MELNDYQEKAMTTCMPSSENFSYMMLNLVGEVGEFASKVAKAIRKEQAQIGGFIDSGTSSKNVLTFKEFPTCIEQEAELKKEAGDILWQLSGLCTIMGWRLEDVAQMNLDKLASRKERNVIDGNGDNR